MSRKRKVGFALMDPVKHREVAGRGGRSAHAKGTAHEFTAQEAIVAGRKGGLVISRDRAHMSAIGSIKKRRLSKGLDQEQLGIEESWLDEK